jgi:hypothetical protein
MAYRKRPRSPIRMTDLVRLARVSDGREQCLGQLELPIAGFPQKDLSSSGTSVLLGQFSENRLSQQFRKHTLIICYLHLHVGLCCAGKLLWYSVLARPRPLLFLTS